MKRLRSGASFTNMDNLSSARISNYMPSKVSGEITYPFPNLNGSTIVSHCQSKTLSATKFTTPLPYAFFHHWSITLHFPHCPCFVTNTYSTSHYVYIVWMVVGWIVCKCRIWNLEQYQMIYREIFYISRTKPHILNVSRLFFVQSIGAGIKLKMKMSVLLQLHLSDHQFCCLLRCGLY